jgi:hypothetical protein
MVIYYAYMITIAPIPGKLYNKYGIIDRASASLCEPTPRAPATSVSKHPLDIKKGA